MQYLIRVADQTRYFHQHWKKPFPLICYSDIWLKSHAVLEHFLPFQVLGKSPSFFLVQATFKETWVKPKGGSGKYHRPFPVSSTHYLRRPDEPVHLWHFSRGDWVFSTWLVKWKKRKLLRRVGKCPLSETCSTFSVFRDETNQLSLDGCCLRWGAIP